MDENKEEEEKRRTEQEIKKNKIRKKNKKTKKEEEEEKEEEERKKKEEEIIYNNQKFLFNYSNTQNMVYNYETKSFIFKYYSSDLNILDFISEIYYCFARFDLSKIRPKIIPFRGKVFIFHDLNDIRIIKEKINDYSDFIEFNSYLHSLMNKLNNGKTLYNNNSTIFRRIYPNYYIYKILIFLINFKNKELIKSINPFYYKIYEFIEFMYTKSRIYLKNLKSTESKIFISGIFNSLNLLHSF